MSLTQIQQDAIAKARRGDYALLDAMELKHRIEHDGALHGYLVGGRLRLIAYGEALNGCCDECDDGKVECTKCEDGFIDCETCKGDDDHLVPHEACGGKGCDGCHDGRVNCQDCKGHGDVRCDECLGDEYVDCEDCDGTGNGEPTEFEDLRITNLDGRVLWREDDRTEPDHPTGWEGQVDRAWADAVLADYQNEQTAGLTTATPAGANAGQTSMLPEPA